MSQSGQTALVTPCMTPLRPLFPHQKRALDWISQHQSGVALFMEMRLGKSKVVIEYLRSVTGRFLIVAPLTVLTAWQNELNTEGETFITLTGTKPKRLQKIKEGNERLTRYFLVNYEGLHSIPDITLMHWGAVVLDESTRIKNQQAKITRLLCNSFRYCPIRIILSGKPAPESPMDYFSQFQFLHDKFMGFNNFWSFRHTAFFQPAGYDWLPKPSWKQKIKDYVQDHSFILSRKDAGIGNKKFYETRYIPLEPEQKRIIRKIEKEFILETNEQDLMTKWVPVKYVWMAQVAGGFVDHQLRYKGKYNELINLIKGELKDEQVVVWFRFNEEIKEAFSMVKKNTNVGVRSIIGETTFENRSAILSDFKQNKFQVLLLQERIGLFGLDLSTASTAIYFSNGFSLETRAQTEDRIENPSKNEPLLIIDLVTERTIDEYVLKALKRKNRDSKYFMVKDIYDQIKR